MSPSVKWALLGMLAAVAAAYFAFVAFKSRSLAEVLLRRGWGERGWSAANLALMLRVLGGAGFLVALAGITLCVARILG